MLYLDRGRRGIGIWGICFCSVPEKTNVQWIDLTYEHFSPQTFDSTLCSYHLRFWLACFWSHPTLAFVTWWRHLVSTYDVVCCSAWEMETEEMEKVKHEPANQLTSQSASWSTTQPVIQPVSQPASQPGGNQLWADLLCRRDLLISQKALQIREITTLRESISHIPECTALESTVTQESWLSWLES